MKNLKDQGFSKYCVTKEGKIYSLRSERFIKTQDRGYEMVSLRNDEGKLINLYIHRVVALAFVEGYEENKHVNHKDGVKSNNHYKNLEWVTRSENMIHAFRNGLITAKPVMDSETVHKICRLLEQGSRPVDVANMVGVTPFNVQDVLEGTTFQDISTEYDFSKVKRKFRLSQEKVIRVCELLSKGNSTSLVANKLDVNIINVRRIYRRETFKHLSDQYSW